MHVFYSLMQTLYENFHRFMPEYCTCPLRKGLGVYSPFESDDSVPVIEEIYGYCCRLRKSAKEHAYLHGIVWM